MIGRSVASLTSPSSSWRGTTTRIPRKLMGELRKTQTTPERGKLGGRENWTTKTLSRLGSARASAKEYTRTHLAIKLSREPRNSSKSGFTKEGGGGGVASTRFVVTRWNSHTEKVILSLKSPPRAYLNFIFRRRRPYLRGRVGLISPRPHHLGSQVINGRAEIEFPAGLQSPAGVHEGGRKDFSVAFLPSGGFRRLQLVAVMSEVTHYDANNLTQLANVRNILAFGEGGESSPGM